MKRIMMGTKAWAELRSAVPQTTGTSGIGSPIPWGTPIEVVRELDPDDVWIEHDDGMWERIAAAAGPTVAE